MFYFIGNGFNVCSPSYRIEKNNTVEITIELINVLKRHWQQTEKIKINYDWENGNILIVHYSSSIIKVGTFSDDKKDDIINCLFNIRDYEPILKLYNNVYKSLDKIRTNEEKLCNDIEENVIMKFQINIYKTSCEECKKLNNNQ
jgi:hypothetical protein